MKKIGCYIGFFMFALLSIFLVGKGSIAFPGRYGGSPSVVDGFALILMGVLPLVIAISFLLEVHWPYIARRIGGGLLLSGFLIAFAGFMVG
ncbi:hypothetical protein [Microbulbifer elongatus]|uniref:hypothetical protein n=1 Tax=Microbulbifer elongatus TaxID=86173 RepID=UPI001CFD4C0B|nr:hypothetical protein [Microbulbifer elongatus]